MEDLGERLARAIASKDRPALLRLLDDAVDFKGLTPNRFWEASAARDVADVFFGSWFEDTDVVDRLEAVETGTVGDRRHVAYRLRVTNGDGPHVVEQQAYYAPTAGGRVGWLRILCSGYRPAPA